MMTVGRIVVVEKNMVVIKIFSAPDNAGCQTSVMRTR